MWEHIDAQTKAEADAKAAKNPPPPPLTIRDVESIALRVAREHLVSERPAMMKGIALATKDYVNGKLPDAEEFGDMIGHLINEKFNNVTLDTLPALRERIAVLEVASPSTKASDEMDRRVARQAEHSARLETRLRALEVGK